MLGITLYVAGTYLAVGAALAAWSIFQGFIMPLGRVLRHFFTDHRLIEKRGPAILVTALMAAAVALAAVTVPVPLRSTVRRWSGCPRRHSCAPHDGSGATLRYITTATETIIYGDIDGDGAGDFGLRLDGVFTLTAGDFVL